jgi:hypothetical protein
MALNLFHDHTIPSRPFPRRGPRNTALVPGAANDASFFTAFSSGLTEFVDPTPQSGKVKAEAYRKELLMYGLATVAVLYVIYRR